MMKKIFISFSLLMMAILPVFAQNSHWEYQGAYPTSAITVVHSNGKAYLFQANANIVVVSVLIPSSLLLVNDDYYFPLNNVVLQGAYEDFNGDIVVYGSYNNYPVVALYDPAAHHILQFVTDTLHRGDCFIDGCCGYDIYGNLINMLVLKNAGSIIPIDWISLGVFPTGTIITPNTLELGKNEYISDVAWDSYNSCFAAAGYQYAGNGPQLCLMGFLYDNTNTTFLCSSPFSWYIQTPNGFGYADYRTNLEILNNNEIVVGQSVRDIAGDWIWLTTIANYSTDINSTIFQFPAQKLFMSDMKYDNDNNKLTILGEMNGCSTTYIAQVNPYTLSGMTTAQITGNMPYSICQYNQNILYGNDISLQKLELNPYTCNHIIATGTYNSNEAYITETYDVSQSICDILMSPNEQNVNNSNGISTPIIDTTKIQVNNLIVQFFYFNPLTSNLSCLDNRPCISKNMDFTKGKALESSASLTIMENGILYFQGFKNGVDYVIYDATGRIVTTGNTENEMLQTNLGSPGFYIISAKDHCGNALTKKFICTHE